MADLPTTPHEDQPGPKNTEDVRITTAPRPSPPSLPPEPVDEMLAYRPLSPLAIIGFCVALVYAAIIVVGGIAAFLTHSPLLLGPLTFVSLAFMAVILCGLAWLQITRSEGTRAGLALAKWGLGLSVIFGLSYSAFYLATYLALRNQADGFTQEWLTMIREGKMNQAFLKTQDPAVRATIQPEDEVQMQVRFDTSPAPGRPGQLTFFRQSDLVRALRQGGNEAKIISQGVREWDWVGQRCNVKRAYRIEAPEGEFGALISVTRMTSTKGEFQGQQWVVHLEQTGVETRKLSERGQLLLALRDSSYQVAQQWFSKVAFRQFLSAYTDACDPAERARLESIFWSRLYLLNLLPPASVPGASALGLELSRWAPAFATDWTLHRYAPGYEERMSKLLTVNEAKLRASDAATRKTAVANFLALFKPEQQTANFRGAMVDPNCIHQPLVEMGERAQVSHDLRADFFPFQIRAVITLESTPGYQDPKNTTWKVLHVEMVGFQHLQDPMSRGMMAPPPPEASGPKKP